MTILLECPQSIKRYSTFIDSYEEVVSCPTCGINTRKHGVYHRKVFFKNKFHLIKILRRRCSSCKITHALIPSFIVPWGRFMNHLRELFIWYLWSGFTVNHLINLLTELPVSPLSLRTLYRWKNRILTRIGEWWIIERKRVAIEYDSDDGILELYRQRGGSVEEFRFLLLHFAEEFGKGLRIGFIFSTVNLHFSRQEMYW